MRTSRVAERSICGQEVLCMAKVVFHGLRVLTAVAVDYSVDYFQKGRPKPFLPRSLT